MAQKKSNSNILILAVFIPIVLAVAGVLILTVFNNRVAESPTDDNSTPIANSEGISIYNPPKPVHDFTMPASTGENVSLSDFRGKLVLIAFGYTRCPDVCPTNMLEYRKIKRFLNANADEVVFLFISVDGERDTPSSLRDYMALYDASFIGLSGTDETLAPLMDDYGLYYGRIENPRAPQEYLIDHTATRFLIDKQGNLSRVYSYTTDARAITRDILSILAGG
ncbi:MAG: SCO family protein [Phototrophicales bacterium]|nr:MAG: SCO family protein [Phototrophicales bacterium]